MGQRFRHISTLSTDKTLTQSDLKAGLLTGTIFQSSMDAWPLTGATVQSAQKSDPLTISVLQACQNTESLKFECVLAPPAKISNSAISFRWRRLLWRRTRVGYQRPRNLRNSGAPLGAPFVVGAAEPTCAQTRWPQRGAVDTVCLLASSFLRSLLGAQPLVFGSHLKTCVMFQVSRRMGVNMYICIRSLKGGIRFVVARRTN